MITPIIVLVLLTLPLCVAYLVSSRFFLRRPYAGFDSAGFAAMGLGVVYLFTCMGHFVRTAPMVEMLPAWVPMRELIVYATGFLELVIAIGLFIPAFRRAAALAAVATLIAFFPANVYAAWNYTGMGGHQWGPVYLLIRAPLQLILIAWAYGFCIQGSQLSQNAFSGSKVHRSQ